VEVVIKMYGYIYYKVKNKNIEIRYILEEGGKNYGMDST